MSSALSILVIDDSKALCQYLISLFKELGVNKCEYSLTAESALSSIMCQPKAYDALIVDLHLDGMDGLQFIYKLNEMKYEGAIIVISALDQKILEFTAEVISKYDLRILGSIHKPFDKSSIQLIVRRLESLESSESQLCEHPAEEILKIENALKKNSLIPYYQPKVEPENNKIIGLECLARLLLEDGSMLLPETFLPLANKSDTITQLTLSLIRTAIPDYLQFLEQTNLDCQLSINISPVQLLNDDFPDTILEEMENHKIPNNRLIFEITENLPVRSSTQIRNLNRLRIKGFGLSLDDYGSGFTSLRQLKTLPYTEIKLDRKIVHGIDKDPVSTVVARSIVKTTKRLGIPLIAEGVESSEELNKLVDLGVHKFQGFLFTRPKPLSEIIRWAKAWARVARVYDIPERR